MRIGPGFVVAAAFIGPGTISTATVAGANHGYTLIWALVISLVATYYFQEMSARWALTQRIGLAEGLRRELQQPLLRWLTLALIMIAIGVGNAAYQAGNLLGATAGAAMLIESPRALLTLLLAGFAGTLLWLGRYHLIERILIVLVAMMALVFLATMLAAPPTLAELASGLRPSLNADNHLIVLALIGTTVVPYNLFLYAQNVQERWRDTTQEPLQQARSLHEARTDLRLSIGVGGLITLAIVSTAATTLGGNGGEITPLRLAEQLQPLLGSWAKHFAAAGLLAAGLTSAITAPLAAGITINGALGRNTAPSASGTRIVSMIVLGIGTGFALTDVRPIAAIVTAQAANALLLPVIAIALVWLANRAVLGEARNGWVGNMVGVAVILLMLGLGLPRLWALVS